MRCMMLTYPCATPLKCEFCVHFIRHDHHLCAAVCRHVDRPRLNPGFHHGCGYWQLHPEQKGRWLQWVDDDLGERLTRRRAQRTAA